MAMQHSRSRLTSTNPPFIGEHDASTIVHLNKKSAQSALMSHSLQLKLQPYMERWPQLVISASVFFALYRLMSSYYPEQLAHVLLPNSYLGITTLWLIGSWYLWSFILRHTKLSFSVSLISTLWIFTRLQQMITPWWVWICLLALPFLIRFAWQFLRQRRV